MKQLLREAYLAGLCGFVICFGLALLAGGFKISRFGPQSVLVSPELQDPERVASSNEETEDKS